MNLKYSQEALKIIQAHLNHKPILLRYKGIGGKWHSLDTTAHLNWNFAKYEYKIDTEEKSEEDFMKEVYKSELGSSFERVDNGVCRGLYKEST